jgi:antitoxin (DNA-binding transcriptional repressor) of toxin-antitoxin stability system
MREVGAFEAKNRLSVSELLRLAEAGEEIAITNRGRIVARPVPPGPTLDLDEAHAAAARIQARRKGVTLGGLTIKELIEAGRQ